MLSSDNDAKLVAERHKLLCPTVSDLVASILYGSARAQLMCKKAFPGVGWGVAWCFSSTFEQIDTRGRGGGGKPPCHG